MLPQGILINTSSNRFPAWLGFAHVGTAVRFVDAGDGHNAYWHSKNAGWNQDMLKMLQRGDLTMVPSGVEVIPWLENLADLHSGQAETNIRCLIRFLQNMPNVAHQLGVQDRLGESAA